MRAWAVLALLMLIAGAVGPAFGHHSGPTAGIIRTGPQYWDVHIGQAVTQTLEGQIHADRPQDILIGLPSGFPDCPDCQADWIDVQLIDTEPPLGHDPPQATGHALALDNATWAFDQVLRVRFTVTFRIGDDAPSGTLPFEPGIRTTPATCAPEQVCLGAGAVSRVTAHVSPRPSVTITSPDNGTITADGITVTGSVLSPHTIVRTWLLLDNDAVHELEPGTRFTHILAADSITNGTHRLTVTSTDSIGRSGDDTVWFHIDRQEPTVALDSPRPEHLHLGNDTTASLGIPFTVTLGPTPIRANATDEFGIDHVRMCVVTEHGETLRCVLDTHAPYEDHEWHHDVPAGRYRITAQAIDLVGHRSDVASVDIVHVKTT